ncbi:MAG TPA: Ig-like domain-containing protein [Trebonia sp.]|nr:Ig-like domain-containing protein [Trebonia sp.]
MRAIRGISGVALAGLVAAVTACSGGSASAHPAPGAGGDTASAAASAPAPPSPSGPGITITPASGAAAADPSAGISVSTDGGRLTSVSVRAGGAPVTVDGSYGAGHASWHSTWALDVDQSYTVTATASGPGGVTAAKTSSFRTLAPARRLTARIFEGYQQTYGVGMPVIVTFSQPVTDRAAVERAITLTTSKPVTGAWYWDGDQTLDFRPRDYWPAHTTVSFAGHFAGVKAGAGLYGYHTLTQTFTIGDSVIAVASTKTHKTQVYVNGHLKYDWPISTGKPGDATPNGSYLTIEKANPVRMKGPGYDLLVPWSVRFTFSGDYYHDAYWSVGEQGFENVSHGCVNLAPANAETYYKLAVPAVGQRLDRVVPHLEAAAEGLGHRPGGDGRRLREQVRGPGDAAGRHRHRAAGHRGERRQCLGLVRHCDSRDYRLTPWSVSLPVAS